MTSFGVVVCWVGDLRTEIGANQMLAPVRRHCTDGTLSVTVPGAVVSVGVRATEKGKRPDDAIFLDWERRRVAVGSIQIYDRSTAFRTVGARSSESDLAVMVRILDQFGAKGLADVAGDFSLVIWNWSERSVLAVRDHFGMRPLLYRAEQNGVAFATDVRSLMLFDSISEPDEEMALDFLLSDYRHYGRTFFRNIRQVRPAHALSIAGTQRVERRYWYPPSRQSSIPTYQEALEEWRQVFMTAVRQRLTSDYPIVAHLSGGLDSGSIVGAAHGIYADSPGRPTLTTLTATFPGLDCDESEFVAAVLQRTPLFGSKSWNGLEANLEDFEVPRIAMPGLRRGPGAGPARDLELAKSLDARIIFSGIGGDESGWSRGVFSDLFGSLRLLDMANEIIALGSGSRVAAHVKDGIRGLLPLRHSPERSYPSPPWLGTSLKEYFPRKGEKDDASEILFLSHVQRQVWQALTSPLVAICVDMLTVSGSDFGVEVRAPYLDIRLVNLVLGIPWHMRLPRGDMRRLQRDAVAPFLPNRVRMRLTKPNFVSAISYHARIRLPRVYEVVHDPRWISDPFIDQAAVRRLLHDLTERDPDFQDWRGWRNIWLIAAFEVWLRQVSAYNAA